jgi:hypothetical protein
MDKDINFKMDKETNFKMDKETNFKMDKDINYKMDKDINYKMDKETNYEMKEYLCIILKIPYKYNISKFDPKIHLLFHSISQLGGKFNYKLHIIAETSDINEKIKNISILYINDNYIDIEKTLYNIIDNKNFHKVLYLDPTMIITNPNDIKLSPLYMNKYHIKNNKYHIEDNKYHIKNNKPKISNINPFYFNNKLDIVMKISSNYIADILINDITKKDVLQNLNKLTMADNIKISCLIVVNPDDKIYNYYDITKLLILKSLKLYDEQNHINKELILVCNTDFKQSISKYYNNNNIKNIKIIYDNNNDFIKLKKIGCNECQGDYLFLWNLEDWYHSSILSIFADKVVKENLDFYTLSMINCYYKGNYYLSYDKFTGWFNIIMLKKDKIHLYSDNNKNDNEMLSILWDKCDKFYIFECEYACLYIKMNNTQDYLQIISPLQDYYSAIINTQPQTNSLINNESWYNKIYKYFF